MEPAVAAAVNCFTVSDYRFRLLLPLMKVFVWMREGDVGEPFSVGSSV
jgi:hypothetical protein